MMKAILFLLLGLSMVSCTGCGNIRPHQQIPVEAKPIFGVPNAWALPDEQFLKLVSYDKDAGLILGVYFVSSDIIYVKVGTDYKMTYSCDLVLLHEMAHREDRKLGAEGASYLWRVLASMREGDEYITHPESKVMIGITGLIIPDGIPARVTLPFTIVGTGDTPKP